MKGKALDEVLSKVTKVLSHPRLRPDQSDRLRRAKRELEKFLHSGRLNERRLIHAIQIVATVLLELVQDDVTAR
jgi:hypothetical protein